MCGTTQLKVFPYSCLPLSLMQSLIRSLLGPLKDDVTIDDSSKMNN